MYVEGRWESKVVRFPIEKRVKPNVGVLADLAPDSRIIPVIAEEFNLEEISHDLRHQADREMADHLVTLGLPAAPAARQKLLEDMREELLAVAIAASVVAKQANDAAYHARIVALEAEGTGGHNARALTLRADRLLKASAEATLEAHRLCEIASGKCRAITFCEMEEEWYPFESQDETEWLVQSVA
jgi:hypothetical protein